MNVEASAEGPLFERCALLSVLLVVIAALRIVSTYTALSHTVDEPIHLGAGMEYLDHGTLTGDVSHPPMARVLSALGPWLAGEHWNHTGNTTTDGTTVLGHDAHYDRMLALARLGILPLFLLACAIVFLWGNRTGGPLAALFATFLFTTLPPVLAHAGVVTTDMAATAFTAAGAYAALLWAERPDWRRTSVLGLTVGLGMLAKYSLLVFLPAIFAAMYLCQWRGVRAIPVQIREHWRQALVAAAIACLVIWAGFKFSWGQVNFAHISLPAPRFFDGLNDVRVHNRDGHASFILGKQIHYGVWYFFPLTLAVKTPFALLLLLALCGAGWHPARRLFTGAPWRVANPNKLVAPLLYSAVILAIGMSSRINIGVRHILPIYVGLAILGGVAASAMLRNRAAQIALFLLCGWQVISGALAHPDYLSYTNEITRGHPENFVAESDLDWGQDMHLVGDFLKRAGATEVSFTPYNVTYLESGHAFPKTTRSNWFHAEPGWNVVSLGGWKVYNHPGWVNQRPPQFRIGRSHWAWYFKPGDVPSVPGEAK